MEERITWFIVIGAGVLFLSVVFLVATYLLCLRCRRKKSRRCVRDSSISWQPVGRMPHKRAIANTPLMNAETRVPMRIAGTSPRSDYRPTTVGLHHSASIQKLSTRSLDDLDSIPVSASIAKPVPAQLSSRRHPPSAPRSLKNSSHDLTEGSKSKESQLHGASQVLVEEVRKCLASAGPTPEFLAEDWSTPTRQPTVEFSVTYASSSKAFVVHVTRIINLYVKPRKSSSTIYVKIKLVRLKGCCGVQMVPVAEDSETAASPTAGQPVVVDWSKHLFDPENGTYFAFSGHNQEDLRQYSLRLSVYEVKIKLLREKRMGTVDYSLAQLELASDVPVKCIQKLISPTSSKSQKKTKEEILVEENSQLMLSLFYQNSANRIKVLVRKAANLPKKKRRLGQPEFYVVVNAVSCGNVMATRETKSVHGRSPVWNEPFIFDLPEKDVDKYFLQFVVMSDKLCRQDGIVGQVVIGPDVRGLGNTHWHEAFERRATEAVKWHKLQPL